MNDEVNDTEVIAPSSSSRKMSLDEFVMVYNTAALVETMGAFRSRERQADRLADFPEEYLSRLEQFKNEKH